MDVEFVGDRARTWRSNSVVSPVPAMAMPAGSREPAGNETAGGGSCLSRRDSGTK